PGYLDAVGSTVRYLPTGIAYAVFAPFPWENRRRADLAATGEMLALYVAWAAAAAALITKAARWRSLLPIALFVCGVLLTLALAEGNVGTLYRHRAMLTPWILLLAAPSLSSLVWRGTSRATNARPSATSSRAVADVS